MSQSETGSKSAVDAVLIDLYRKEFDDGDRYAVLQALTLCLRDGYRIPEWARAGFLDSIGRIESGAASTWDAVFGKAKPIAKSRRHYWKAHKVLLRVVEAKASGKPIDQELFDEIGKELHISGSTAKQYYYSWFGTRRPRRTSKKRS